jgi:hypothetical protein
MNIRSFIARHREGTEKEALSSENSEKFLFQ